MRWFWRARQEETNHKLKNPGRGWYQIYSFAAEVPIDKEELTWCLDQEDALVLILIDIGDYKEMPIDAKGLEHIRQILDFFRTSGKDIVLRPVYDREGKGIEREPSDINLVLEHIRQLGEIIREYADVIVTIQGVLVGNWGEMHGSRYLTEERLKRLWKEIDNEFRGSFYLAVRRPFFWRVLEAEEKESWNIASYTGRLGLFDDGIFGSNTHLGTFGEGRPEDSWKIPWTPKLELDFEKWLGNFAPCGGEVVYPMETKYPMETDFNPSLSSEAVIERLGSMRVSYLNKAYDRQLLDQWEEMSCPFLGIWKGLSLLDYIDRHLGYRFVIRKVKPVKLGCRSIRQLEVQVENRGFSGIYQETSLWLVLERNGMEEPQRVLLQYDARDWKGGSKSILYIDIPNVTKGRGDVEVYLELERKWDGSKVLFANKGGLEGRVRLGTCRGY